MIEDNLKQVRKLVELDMDSLSIGKKIKHKMIVPTKNSVLIELVEFRQPSR